MRSGLTKSFGTSAVSNNSLRSHLSPLGFSSALINALIDSPTGIWRNEHKQSQAARDLLNLSTEQKRQVVDGYVRGFKTMFYVLTALIGVNL